MRRIRRKSLRPPGVANGEETQRPAPRRLGWRAEVTPVVYVGFLGSRPIKDQSKARSVAGRRSGHLLRAAISITIGATVLVFALQETFAWLITGRWPGYRMLSLAEDLARAPIVSGGSWPGGLALLQEAIRVVLEALPVSLVGLVIGAWVSWRMFPRRRGLSVAGARANGPQTAECIAAEIRRIPGESLVIVSRHRPRLFTYLEQVFRNNPKVHVIIDRRWSQRRVRHEAHEGDRRGPDRRRRPDLTDAVVQQPDVIVAPRASGNNSDNGRPGGTR